MKVNSPLLDEINFMTIENDHITTTASTAPTKINKTLDS